jgi:hypothetical protein
VGGDDSHVVYGHRLPVEKRSVMRCVVVMQQPVLLSPNFGTNFHAVAVKKVIVLWGIGCLACHDKFFVNNPLDVK